MHFEFDLASADRILDRYLDQEVTAVLEGGDAFVGKLVSYAGGALVLVTDERTTVLSRDEVHRMVVGRHELRKYTEQREVNATFRDG